MTGRWIHETTPGTFEITLGDEEREALHRLIRDLRDLLLAGSDESLRRLYPPAHPDDEKREKEYNALVHDQLLEARLESIDLMEQTIDRSTLSEEELNRWMQVVNELRLVLGTQLDVSEEDEREWNVDHPGRAAFEQYESLGYLLAEIVDALARE